MNAKAERQAARFYDTVAAHYRDIEQDWDAWVGFNRRVFEILISRHCPGARTVLDCAAGVGSQALALEAMGLDVTATDLSARALEELARHSNMRTRVASWEALPRVFDEQRFDVICCMDNAIGHTADEDALKRSLAAMAQLLSSRRDASLFVSTRDFDVLAQEKPDGFPARRSAQDAYWQLWEWTSPTTYCATWYIEGQRQGSADMRCIFKRELSDAAKELELTVEECEKIYTQPDYRFSRAC